MTTITLTGLGTGGIFKDIPPHLLPPEVWSEGTNVKLKDGYATRHLGFDIGFSPALTPGFVFNVPGVSDSFWLYASTSAVRGYSGGSDADVTRLAGPYTAANLRDWGGCLLGGVPILNNQADVPQYWPTIALGTRLAALPAWPAALRAKNVKNFGRFLVAMNLIDAGVPLAHALRWSHPADPGTVPVSWDPSDATHDAGQTHLTDVQGGELLNGLVIGSMMVLYKQRSAHIMRFIGGSDIFAFDFLFNEGLLTPRTLCLIDSGKRHFAVGENNIYAHSGTKDVTYPLDLKSRRAIYAELDQTNFLNSFCFDKPDAEEAWFCYPTSGATYPNKALTWNYRTNTIGFRTVDWLSLDIGVLTPATDTWDTTTGAWDTDNQPWNPKGNRTLLGASPVNSKIWRLDSGFKYGDVNGATWNLQRTGLAIVGRSRTGEPIADYTSQKLFTRVWTKARGEGTLQVRLGVQDEINGSVSWDSFQLYDPAVRYNDFDLNGRLCAIEYKSQTDADIRLEGYDLEFSIVSGL